MQSRNYYILANHKTIISLKSYPTATTHQYTKRTMKTQTIRRTWRSRSDSTQYTGVIQHSRRHRQTGYIYTCQPARGPWLDGLHESPGCGTKRSEHHLETQNLTYLFQSIRYRAAGPAAHHAGPRVGLMPALGPGLSPRAPLTIMLKIHNLFV